MASSLLLNHVPAQQPQKCHGYWKTWMNTKTSWSPYLLQPEQHCQHTIQVLNLALCCNSNVQCTYKQRCTTWRRGLHGPVFTLDFPWHVKRIWWIMSHSTNTSIYLTNSQNTIELVSEICGVQTTPWQWHVKAYQYDLSEQLKQDYKP